MICHVIVIEVVVMVIIMVIVKNFLLSLCDAIFKCTFLPKIQDRYSSNKYI